VNIGAAAAGPFDRLAGSGSRPSVHHAAALVAVGGAVAVLELGTLGLDHGTHLLVVLTLVIGVAVRFGPRPATTALVVGGAVATAGSVITVDHVFDTPLMYVQVLAYLLAGTAVIVLVSALVRSRQQPSHPASPKPATTSGKPGLPESLTARELEVLRLAASGISVEELARQLFVSPNTAKTHLSHVYAKLGARGRSDAVRAAFQCGYLFATDICPHHLADEPTNSPIPVMTKRPNG